MHELYELKEKLMEELEAYGKRELSAGSLEVVDKLAHSIKNICKILEESDGEGYSREGGDNGRYSYDDGSYLRNGGGSYARNRRRDSMGRYSRAAGVEEMVETVRGMMQDLPQEVRQDAQRFLTKLEQQM